MKELTLEDVKIKAQKIMKENMSLYIYSDEVLKTSDCILECINILKKQNIFMQYSINEGKLYVCDGSDYIQLITTDMNTMDMVVMFFNQELSGYSASMDKIFNDKVSKGYEFQIQGEK